MRVPGRNYCGHEPVALTGSHFDFNQTWLKQPRLSFPHPVHARLLIITSYCYSYCGYNSSLLFPAARRRTTSKSVILTEAQKQLMVHKLPQVLRLHLKRFRYESPTPGLMQPDSIQDLGTRSLLAAPLSCSRLRWSGRNHREKIGVHVSFDQLLNMESYCCQEPSPRDLSCSSPSSPGSASSSQHKHFLYDLSAVVMHHGKGFGSGHYTSYCYNTEGGESKGRLKTVGAASHHRFD